MDNLTPEDIEALKAYAAEKGRSWKQHLAQDWMLGRAVGDRGVILYRLRNRLGPSWLVNYRLQ
ncbi:hypothetical protein ACTG4Q_20975 [Bradyrhizobium denitrificans]